MASLFKSKKKGHPTASGGSHNGNDGGQTPSPSSSIDKVHTSGGPFGSGAGQSPLGAGQLEPRRLAMTSSSASKQASGGAPAVNGSSAGPSSLQGQDAARVPQYPWSSRKLSNHNPFPRYGHATNALAGKEGDLYIFGGLVKELAKADLWIIETAGLQASQVTTSGHGPSPRVGHAALLVGNAFIVFGGDTKLNSDKPSADNDENLYLLNTTTKLWSVASVSGARPAGRYGHTLNMLGPKVLVFGGQVEGFFFNDLVAFDLNTLNHAAPRWELITPIEGSDPPPSRTNHIAVTHQDKLYVFGGTNGIDWFNDMWSFDPLTRLWTLLKCSGFVPQPREGHAACLVGDVIYVFGGRDLAGNDLGDLAAFKISTARWFTFQNMGAGPSPRSGHALSTVGKRIFVVGGEGASVRGDEQVAYILDTTKIRYPADAKPASTMMQPGGGMTQRQASQGMQETIQYSEPPAQYPRSLEHPPDGSRSTIRSVSGQSTTAPTRLPGPVYHNQNQNGPVAAGTGHSPSGIARPSTRDLPPLGTGMRRGSALPSQYSPGGGGNGGQGGRPSTSGSTRNVSQPNPIGFRQAGTGAPLQINDDVRGDGTVQQGLQQPRMKRSGSLDSLLDSPDRRTRAPSPTRLVQETGTQPAQVQSPQRQQRQQQSSSVKSPQQLQQLQSPLQQQLPSPQQPQASQQQQPQGMRQIPRMQSLEQMRPSSNGGALQSPPSLQVDTRMRQLVTPLDMTEDRDREARRQLAIADRDVAPPLRHASSMDRLATMQSERDPPVSASGVTLAQSMELKAKNAWLLAELNAARRQGYLPSENVDGQALDAAPDASPALLAVYAEVSRVKEELDAAKTAVQAQIRQSQSERDAALREAAFERARNTALVHSDSEMMAGLERTRCAELEERLAQAVWQHAQVQREMEGLRRESATHAKTHEESSATLASHAEALGDYEARYAALAGQYEALQRTHLDVQTEKEQHRSRAVTLETDLAQRTFEAEKLRDLEERHARHISVVAETQAAVQRATQRATDAETALEQERGEAQTLRQQLADAQAALTKHQADVASHAARNETLQRDLETARQDSDAARKSLAAGLGELVTRARNFGPHDDPTVHKAQAETLGRSLHETRSLHTATREQVDAHVAELKRAGEQIQVLERKVQESSRQALAGQRQVLALQQEKTFLESKMAASQAEMATKQSQLEEVQMRLSTLQQLTQEKAAQAEAQVARRDSVERRGSRMLTSPMSLRGMGSSTPDTSRLRELEQRLAEAVSLQREMQTSHDKAVAEAQALANRHEESLVRQQEAEARSIRLEQELARGGSANGSLPDELATPTGAPVVVTHDAPVMTARQSMRQSMVPKEVSLAQARAQEAERQLAESTQNYKERLNQLESDYQSAVHYVKGTEKMLRRMKEELGKYKSTNARLQAQLDEAKQGDTANVNGTRSKEEPELADMEAQLKALTHERTQLSGELDASRASFEKQASAHKLKIDQLEAELTEHRAISKDPQTIQRMEQDLEETRLANQKLDFENRDLERRMKEAEGKVSMLLDQFEQKVDTYRRSVVIASPSSLEDEAVTPGARTSSALDMLANELDQLRSHWQQQQASRFSNRASDRSLADGPSSH